MWTSQYYGFWQYWSNYHKVTFDGPNRLILVNYGVTELNVDTDIYSDWKEWMLMENNFQYPEAISVIGGEPLGGGQFVGSTYFLENGWRIRPWEGTHQLSLDGNIYTREAGESPTIPTLGNWSVSTTFVRSAIVFKVETAGASPSGSSPTAQEIATAVWNYNTSQSFSNNTFGNYITTRLLTIAQYLGMK